VSRPVVKVIVPCYDYANWLEGCVMSALDQPGVDVRVLVIDDCSPDETPIVGRDLAAREERVEYRRHRCNVGLIGTANEGLDWADDGDYTVLLSADDLLVRGSLQRATRVMEAAPNVGMVYGRAPYAHVGRPTPSAGGGWRGTEVWDGGRWIRLRCRSGHNCISSPEVVVRTDIQRSAGRYDPNCFHTSDMNMWLRVAARSDIAYVKGVPQAIYRIHGDSMLRSDRSPMLDLRERRAAFDSFFESCGELLDDADALRAMAGRALARQALWIASRAVDRGAVEGPEAVPVEALTAFALDVFPDARRLGEWHGLRLRRAIGPGRSLWFVPFLLTGAAHRARVQADRLRWIATGV
jgi:glycosyltransferase involved in cell wall biosynthesis